MNVLLSSAGRQVFLVEAFRKALAGKGMVFATDNNSAAPALSAADRGIPAPPFSEEKYGDWILGLCEEESIELLLTLNVDDLLVLEHHRTALAGINCMLVGGQPEMIRTTYDKWSLFRFCRENGIDTPETYLPEELLLLPEIPFPLVAKQRFGKAGRGQMVLNNHDDLNRFLLPESGDEENSEPYLFQSFIDGTEYGFDLVNDFDSNFAGLLARRKYRMKNGETNIAETIPHEPWLRMAGMLSAALQHQGTVDMDAMYLDNRMYIIDINFRFGGGYAFSHLAGADIPQAYVNWKMGIKQNAALVVSRPGILGERRSDGRVVVAQNP